MVHRDGRWGTLWEGEAPAGSPAEDDRRRELPLPSGEGRGEGFCSLRVLSWAESQIGCAGLAGALREACIEMVPGEVPNDENHQTGASRTSDIELQLTLGMHGPKELHVILLRQ